VVWRGARHWALPPAVDIRVLEVPGYPDTVHGSRGNREATLSGYTECSMGAAGGVRAWGRGPAVLSFDTDIPWWYLRLRRSMP